MAGKIWVWEKKNDGSIRKRKRIIVLKRGTWEGCFPDGPYHVAEKEAPGRGPGIEDLQVRFLIDGKKPEGGKSQKLFIWFFFFRRRGTHKSKN